MPKPDLTTAYKAAAAALPLAGASPAQRLKEAEKAIDAAFPVIQELLAEAHHRSDA